MHEQAEVQTILVVDDDAVTRELLREVLGELADVVCREDGHAALRTVKESPPDLIILDVVMPGPNGFEVCRMLKADHETRDIPVLILTLKDSLDDEARAFEVGAADYVKKPISPRVVRARASNILALQQALKKLERQARVDPLTGSFNRRHFLDVADAEFQRSSRHHQPLCLMMLDIDRFKAINDTYGHGVGDEALVETVRVIGPQLRREDLLGRWGGEEFAILCPQTSLEDTVMLAERLRRALAEVRMETDAGPLAFTVSIGVSAVDDDMDSIAVALAQADAALYRAKEGGRNRVEVTSG